jgi:hypothetical protein
VDVEANLYPPVKAFLEGQGYEVKAEVGRCDVFATRGGEAPVIVELKRSFNLALLLQGIDRLAVTERVYLAVARPRGGRGRGASVYRRDVRKLCRRVGLGLLAVTPAPGGVEVVLDPLPYRPRASGKRRGLLLGEHARRVGDPNRGGVTRTPIMTAYRQEALRCAALIQGAGRASLATLRATGVVPNAARILGRDVYGWFQRVERATYVLTDRARRDLSRFAAAGTLPPSDAASGRPRGPGRPSAVIG